MTTTTLEQDIRQLEDDIIDKKQQLLDLKAKLQAKPTPVSDYTFKDKEGKDVTLLAMFGDRNELMLVHNMGKRCAYCTLWADEINGISHHLENRTSFVVVSPDAPAVMKEFADGRGWKFRICSSNGNSFKKDMGFEKNASATPGVSVFTKDKDGNIFHYNQAVFGPGDNFCGHWYYLGLLPGGAGLWSPKFTY